MTKSDIAQRVYEKVGSCRKVVISKRDASAIVEAIFELLKSHLEKGAKIKISGFGNFVVTEKKPRKGRNPQTGEEILIGGRRVLTFKASPVLKKAMNPNSGG